MDLEKEIEKLNSDSVNRRLPGDVCSILVKAINSDSKGSNYIKNIQKIISISKQKDELNNKTVNGYTSDGIGPTIPLTSINPVVNSRYIEIVKLLLYSGANINGFDSKFFTPLTSFLSYLLKENMNSYSHDYILNCLMFLLGKGADPDGNIFCNPLCMLFKSAPLFYPGDDKKVKFFIKIYECLIAHGASLNFETVTLTIKGTNIYRTPSNIISSYKKNSPDLYNFLINLTSISDDDIIKNCNSDILLDSLRIKYGIPKTLNKTNKELCDCISFIRKNRDKYDENTLIELRKNLRNTECSNDTTFLGDDIDIYNTDEIFTLKSGESRYCFHASEIPSILEKGKNPYTSDPISDEVKRELIEKFNMYKSFTISEALESTLEKIREITLDDYIYILGILLHSFAPYVDTDKLKDFTSGFCIENIFQIYESNSSIFRVNTYEDEFKKLYFDEDDEQVRKRIVSRMLTHILTSIYNKQNIPLISNIIINNIKTYEMIKDIEGVFVSDVILKEFINYASTTNLDIIERLGIDVFFNLYYQKIEIIYHKSKDIKTLLSSDSNYKLKTKKYDSTELRYYIEYLRDKILEIIKRKYSSEVTGEYLAEVCISIGMFYRRIEVIS